MLLRDSLTNRNAAATSSGSTGDDAEPAAACGSSPDRWRGPAAAGRSPAGSPLV